MEADVEVASTSKVIKKKNQLQSATAGTEASIRKIS
jgi:hypothetical protein